MGRFLVSPSRNKALLFHSVFSLRIFLLIGLPGKLQGDVCVDLSSRQAGARPSRRWTLHCQHPNGDLVHTHRTYDWNDPLGGHTCAEAMLVCKN